MSQNRNRPQPAPPAAQPELPPAPPADPPSMFAPDADQAPAVTTEDTAALRGVPPTVKPGEPKRPRLIVSEGVADDLRRLRKVTDPGTGYELRVDDEGDVTAYDRRTGKPADVDVIAPVIA